MIRNFRDGDIVTSGEQFVFDKRYVAQSVSARLKLFTGEYFPDITQGTPWFQSIFGKSPSDVAELIIKERIVTAPGVASLTSFEFSSDPLNRKISVVATVLSEAGEEVTVNVEDII